MVFRVQSKTGTKALKFSHGTNFMPIPLSLSASVVAGFLPNRTVRCCWSGLLLTLSLYWANNGGRGGVGWDGGCWRRSRQELFLTSPHFVKLRPRCQYFSIFLLESPPCDWCLLASHEGCRLCPLTWSKYQRRALGTPFGFLWQKVEHQKSVYWSSFVWSALSFRSEINFQKQYIESNRTYTCQR